MTENEEKPRWISYSGYVKVDNPEENVYQAAIKRIRSYYAKDMPIVVSFSGGKDSTTVLMLTLQAAREFNRLPVTVCMIDEEVIDPDTIEYCKWIRQQEGIDYHWLCLPIRHTLRGRLRDHWITWDPEYQDVWAREVPSFAITQDDIEMPEDSKELSYGTAIKLYAEQYLGFDKFIQVGGVRAAEAFNRLRAVMISGGDMVPKPYGWWAKPIYDWRHQDVWLAIKKFGWPHSKYYDRMWSRSNNPHTTRVAPWGNVASAREVSNYPALYPDFWEKAIRRLPEMRAQERYGNTNLMRSVKKPSGMTWQEYALYILSQLDEDSQRYWKSEIRNYLRAWKRKNTVPFPDEPIPNVSMHSWKQLARAMEKNDRHDGSSRDTI